MVALYFHKSQLLPFHLRPRNKSYELLWGVIKISILGFWPLVFLTFSVFFPFLCSLFLLNFYSFRPNAQTLLSLFCIYDLPNLFDYKHFPTEAGKGDISNINYYHQLLLWTFLLWHSSHLNNPLYLVIFYCISVLLTQFNFLTPSLNSHAAGG